MISMSQAYSIRQLRKRGDSVAEIARKVGVSRNTVYNHLAKDDLSPSIPITAARPKLLCDSGTEMSSGKRVRTSILSIV